MTSLKRSHEDKDKDEDSPAGPDQGLKKKKKSKDVEPSRGSKLKESKTSSSKGTKSQPKSSGKSVQAEEPVFETTDTKMPQDQGGDTKDQSNVEATLMNDWKYTTSTTKIKAAKYDNIEGIKDMVLINKESKHDVFSRKRIIAVTYVKLIKWYGYRYLEEIIVQREDQTFHKFKEGDFPRLNLCDIEDLLFLLVLDPTLDRSLLPVKDGE
ncbi:hypothetical protein Tco_1361169 [Tanacetum coccineum]